jgi:hypothetical protein
MELLAGSARKSDGISGKNRYMGVSAVLHLSSKSFVSLTTSGKVEASARILPLIHLLPDRL